MSITLNEMEARIVERALNVIHVDLSEEEREASNNILERILEERGCGGGFAYIISFIADTRWPPEMVGLAFRTEFYGDGQELAASFDASSISLRDDGRWQLELRREDCETDYHECYVGDGHDGTDAGAIEQLENEMREAAFGAILTTDHRVETRRRL